MPCECQYVILHIVQGAVKFHYEGGNVRVLLKSTGRWQSTQAADTPLAANKQVTLKHTGAPRALS
jgi:hypothetical protein